jgi:hypothetical protein
MEVNIKMDLQEVGIAETWTALIWLRIETGGGLFCLQSWAFGFHKVQVISCLSEDLLASEEGLCSTELVS